MHIFIICKQWEHESLEITWSQILLDPFLNILSNLRSKAKYTASLLVNLYLTLHISIILENHYLHKPKNLEKNALTVQLYANQLWSIVLQTFKQLWLFYNLLWNPILTMSSKKYFPGGIKQCSISHQSKIYSWSYHCNYALQTLTPCYQACSELIRLQLHVVLFTPLMSGGYKKVIHTWTNL